MTRITQLLTVAGLPALFALSIGSAATAHATYGLDQCFGSYGQVVRCCLKNTSPLWMRQNGEHCEAVVVCKKKGGKQCFIKIKKRSPNDNPAVAKLIPDGKKGDGGPAGGLGGGKDRGGKGRGQD